MTKHIHGMPTKFDKRAVNIQNEQFGFFYLEDYLKKTHCSNCEVISTIKQYQEMEQNTKGIKNEQIVRQPEIHGI